MTDIAQRLTAIRHQIERATQAAHRDLSSVQLIAVSKTHDQAAVRQALAAGQRHFGENRVQEAKAKFAVLKTEMPDLQLHLIGPLQTNKVDDAVLLFDVIQTLDRPSLAEALVKATMKTGRTPRLYIEINVGNEPQKAGIAPEDLADFLRVCTNLNLTIDGLMCIPPQASDPTPFFTQLKNIATYHNLPHLSMGMSADFETAIKCGATAVRIGAAIFGKRASSAT